MSTEIITLQIQTKGEVIASNFPAFAEMVRARLTEINRDLKTDEDFDQADADAKAIKSAETALIEAKEKALADAVQLNELFSQIDALTGELSQARLDLSKQVARRKDSLKAEIIAAALDEIICSPRLRLAKFGETMQAAVKGKKSFESMRKALEMAVLVANGTIELSREKIASFVAAHGAEMVMDADDLEIQPPAMVEAELRRRFEAKRAMEERKRIEAQAAMERAEQAKRHEAEQSRLRAEAEAARAQTAAVAREALQAAPDNASLQATVAKIEESQVSPPLPVPMAQPAKVQAYADNNGLPPASAGSEAAEWDEFRKTFLAAFAPIRVARTLLKDAANIAKAEQLAAAINAAWKGVA